MDRRQFAATKLIRDGIAPGVGIQVSNGSLVAQSVGKAQQCNLIAHRFISFCAYQIVAWCDVVKLLVCVVPLVGVTMTVVQKNLSLCQYSYI